MVAVSEGGGSCVRGFLEEGSVDREPVEVIVVNAAQPTRDGVEAVLDMEEEIAGGRVCIETFVDDIVVTISIVSVVLILVVQEAFSV
jgi:hypothetical protein